MLDCGAKIRNDPIKVLIVDDEPNMANAINRTLKAAGFNTCVAKSGLEAGVWLHYFAPDVMTLDLQMPGISGREVLSFIGGLDDFANLKIVIVTGMSGQEVQSLNLAGVDGVLHKPFDNEELVRQVRELAVG